MLFSIIVPAYNAEKYLQECVESVLSQSLKDFELILVDDGSKDDTPKICDEYARKDTRVRVIHKQNGGSSSARNVGIDASAGEYIMFLDSDDYWDDKNALRNIKENISKKEADIYMMGFKKFFQKENKLTDEHWDVDEIDRADEQEDKLKCIMQNNMFIASAWNKIIRRMFLIRNEIKFVVGQNAEDIEWCAKLLLTTNKIIALDLNFYIYRKQNNESISSNINKKILYDISNVIERYAEIAEKTNSIYLKHYLAQQYVLWLTLSNNLKSGNIRDLLKKMKTYWYLINYNYYPYVKKVYKVRKFGVYGVRKMLGIYYLLKNK